jgi:lysophospholipase L1-like esterase
MSSRSLFALFPPIVAVLAACGEVPTVQRPLPPVSARSETHAGIARYVAIGTSLSMGVMSNGVIGSDQSHSWPAQLAELARIPFTQPLIQWPGCQAPLAAPLSTLQRIDGTSVFTRGHVCASLVDGIAAPTQNLALSEALTFDALGTKPETPPPGTWPLRGEFYSRVLAPGQTQLTAMLAQHPDLVSVEFGVNEVLGTRTGLLAPGVTFLPFAFWRPAYDQVIAGVKNANAAVVVVGVITNPRNFPSLRRGAELYANRAELSSFGIGVDQECGGAAAENYIYVPAKVMAAYASAGEGTALSCADVPGTQDFVLTPHDMDTIAEQLAAMNAYIRQVADDNGFAFFDLDPLYGRRDLKAPFSAVALLTSETPYGPLISLDGVHPSAAGHHILAREAARALNVTYHFGIERAAMEAMSSSPAK